MSLSSPAQYPLLLTVKTCLHRCFLSQNRYIDAVISGIKTCVGKLTATGNAESSDAELLHHCVTKLEMKQSNANGDKSVQIVAKKDQEGAIEVQKAP